MTFRDTTDCAAQPDPGPAARIATIAGTRVAAGLGLGLLLADVLQPKPRRVPGWMLLAIGILSTLPLVAYVVHNLHTPFDD